MKVRELIERLQALDPELVVYVADWQQGVSSPDAEQAEFLTVIEKPWWALGILGAGGPAPGPALVIGESPADRYCARLDELKKRADARNAG